MTWNVEFTKQAKKQVLALEIAAQTRIRNAIRDKLSVNPDLHLIQLSGKLSNLYKFRVGVYRLLCAKDGKKLLIAIIKVAHRKEAYH